MLYPVILLRIKAMMLDSIIFACLLILLTYIASISGITDTWIKVVCIVTPMLFLEPMLIWLTGGTIGHHYSGIKVIGKTTGKNLFVLNGLVRFIVKTLFGIYSVVTMLLTRKHQSLHDLLSGSVVVFKNESRAKQHHTLTERTATDETRKPSVLRRILVILVYNALTAVAIGLVSQLLVSPSCHLKNLCTENEDAILAGLALVLIASVIFYVIAGCLCKLPGAYYRRPAAD